MTNLFLKLFVKDHKNTSSPAVREAVGKLASVVTLDRTVAAVLAFMKNNPDTLLIITSDHETGGVTIPEGYHTLSQGDHSHAEGNDTKTYAKNSHAEGNLTYWNKDAQWKRQTIRRYVATAQTYTVMSVPDANPIINIGKVFNDVIGISIISDRGKALNTVRNCWITYFISNDELKELADNGIKPVSSSSSTTVINIETALFSWSCSRDYSSVQAQALTTDNITYYAYNEVGVKGDPLDVTGSTVMTDTGNTVAIDGVTYRICQYTSSVYTFVVELNALSNVDKAWGFDVHYTDGARGSTVDTDTVKTVTIRIMYIGEAPQVPAVVDFIQYIEVVWKTLPNDTVYGIYPATSTSPVTLEHEYTTSVTAGWLTTPNIVIEKKEFEMVFFSTGSHYYKSIINRYLFVSNYLAHIAGINFVFPINLPVKYAYESVIIVII